MKTETEATTTIQATGKYWKAFELIGAILFMSGILSVWFDLGPYGSLMFVIGSITYAYGRIGGWWNHG